MDDQDLDEYQRHKEESVAQVGWLLWMMVVVLVAAAMIKGCAG